MRRPRFEIYPERNSEPTRYRWRLLAANNRVIADGGEAYSSVKSCRRGLITAMNTGDYAIVVNRVKVSK